MHTKCLSNITHGVSACVRRLCGYINSVEESDTHTCQGVSERSRVFLLLQVRPRRPYHPKLYKKLTIRELNEFTGTQTVSYDYTKVRSCGTLLCVVFHCILFLL